MPIMALFKSQESVLSIFKITHAWSSFSAIWTQCGHLNLKQTWQNYKLLKTRVSSVVLGCYIRTNTEKLHSNHSWLTRIYSSMAILYSCIINSKGANISFQLNSCGSRWHNWVFNIHVSLHMSYI